ncbi:MAG: glycosyltransferase family 2 protein [Candidatus Beckwithbacteria bacterium]|nr:glycosyltransferase family 2 protein [Candidatus Beckwithbacteria bacterium]
MKSVSVVMPAFNSIRTIEVCLKSIREQDYGGKVEIVVADGGSTDGTLAVLKKYGCKVVAERTGNPEKAKAIGLKEAKEEFVLLMASDNVLPDKLWLKIMVVSLLKEPEAVAAYPWHYAYRKTDTSLNRYFALMGVNDPVAKFMGKADRQGWGGNGWRLSGAAEDKGGYWLVRFTAKDMPTLGDNGILVWKDKLVKAKVDEKYFSHIDVFYDLVSLGMNQFVVVKNEIVHDTGEKCFKFLSKRFRYMKELYLSQRNMRRFKWVRSWRDKARLGLSVVYSLTLVGPTLEAAWGFMVKPDLAWFWHPVMSVAMVFVYGKPVLIRLIFQFFRVGDQSKVLA